MNTNATINRENVTTTDTTAATGMPFDCTLSAALDSPAVGVTEDEAMVNVPFGLTEFVEIGGSWMEVGRGDTVAELGCITGVERLSISARLENEGVYVM
jgi:hypothetical protein